jgi:hypothetical protein
MIGNGHPFGRSGFVILEEGEINPSTLQLDVRHYLVMTPSGEQVSGNFSFAEAQQYIREQESKLK